MFRVKICGITTLADAQAAAEAGADAIGLNFYAASPRCCPLERAQEIAAQLPTHVCRVGVFVNAAADEVRRTAQAVGLDLIQLHGDEPPEYLRELRPLPIVRGLRIREDLSELSTYLEACYQVRAMPRMLLLDALRPDKYGGTGATLDWDFVSRNRRQFRGLPIVLAGGLTPDNVAAAIATVRPWAVDIASGVETAPGCKSPELIHRFVCTAKRALNGLSARN